MSPKSPKSKDSASSDVGGSGPDGRVEITDIRAKLSEIRGEVDATADQAKPLATYAAVAGVVVLVAVTFLVGRSRGRRKSTWVEIRRL
jgi:pyruvate/2-oxoglutarate dehydrogenase complex dihydrolipoamide acyltransferase (E2) component